MPGPDARICARLNFVEEIVSGWCDAHHLAYGQPLTYQVGMREHQTASLGGFGKISVMILLDLMGRSHAKIADTDKSPEFPIEHLCSILKLSSL